MGEEHIIRTPFDVLLLALQEADSPVGAGRLASACGMGEREVLKWAHMLEKSGKVRIDNRFNGVYVKWIAPIEERRELPQVSPTAVYVSEPTPFEADLKLARQREEQARPKAKEAQERREKVEIAPESSVDVGERRLARVQGLLNELRRKKKESEAKKEESVIEEAKRGAEEEEETVALEVEEKPAFDERPLEEKEMAADDANGLRGHNADRLAKLEEKEMAADDAKEAPVWLEEKEPPAAGEGRLAGPDDEEPAEIEEEGKPHRTVPPKSIIRPKFRRQEIRPGQIAKIKKPEPVHVTGVSLQFSERLARQMKRIERQARAIDELRQEKEALLHDHYLPLQNRLESELETISDRVMRLQAKVAGMQKQASDLPAKVSVVEKAQATGIKAHGEMRRAYDEACALLEESSRLMAEEREKMELLLEQSRWELSRHTAMSGELAVTMDRIEEMEGEASRRVASARAALAEQAERLATAEGHATELRTLRAEIGDSIVQMKREIASSKRVLSDLERQMGQMAQIDEYAATIRKDYDGKMSEIDDYIRNGSREFETLRESVEANFVRRYLRELRALTESYSFEFNQVRRMEGDIDGRIAQERKRLEELFEEGKKISYLFETQSQQPADAGKFERHGEALGTLDGLPSQRSHVAHMIAQVIGGRTEALPKRADIPIFAQKPAETGPIGMTKLVARKKKKARKAKMRKKAAKAKKTAKKAARKIAKGRKTAAKKGRR
jgi:hypothetical protein